MKTAAKFANVVILMIPLLAAAQTLKIGIALPADSKHYWKTQEIKVGAQLAEKRLEEETDFDIEIAMLTNEIEDEAALKQIENKIQNEGITAIVGGATRTSAQVLRRASSFWKIPTVVITPLAWREQIENRNEYVLDLGVSDKEIHRNALRFWKENLDLEKISIIYNADYSVLSEYGSIAKDVLFGNSGSSSLEIKWSDANVKLLEDEIGKIVNEKPDGIVLAGPPWNTNRWINELNMDVPFYIAPPLSGLSEMNALAQHSKNSIYTGSQYWTDPKVDSEYSFTKDAINELGWIEEWPMSPVALRVYDALAIIVKAEGEKYLQPEAKAHWWQELSEVYGIKGKLIHYDDTTLSPEAHLLEMNKNGDVVFFTTRW